MAEPIRRWLRLALGSKPGSPRGREPGGGVEHGGGQIVSPCARSFNSLQTLPWMLQSYLSKISLALCLSVQVKGRKHRVAGTKCKHYGCRSVSGYARRPRQRRRESSSRDDKSLACLYAPPPKHDVILKEQPRHGCMAPFQSVGLQVQTTLSN
ncbi:hypothetical protein M440DRAFT_1066401 [Trichoderma longibrachiatum ATCC 18648]|uniref:Uncharacterized protein n=1 Tax=Trichoderma longibrachiatum ATCC 18648 TaxID=983965 RepID=A0A2T4BW92_TRILO|nr:hypothetical protein M440DRAFT_1066401 [Trichoderma longibrachiatum ATCC 18648]